MALMRALDSRDASYLARFFKPNPAIILQEYIQGRPANRAVVCCQGKVLANSFGPLMRFAVGAKYAARRLSRHLAATSETVGFQAQVAAGRSG